MKPNFKSESENLMGCEMGKIKVFMNKPVYLGQLILDLSKIVMYEFHYDYMKRKYDRDRLQLCYMDTNLLIYHIKTEDFYADITGNVDRRFNTSGYDKKLPIRTNKKVIGLMKDELGGAIMTEFVALRPKLYSYGELDGAEDKKHKGIEKLDGADNKKHKGIEKCIVKKPLTFEEYKSCLFNSDITYRSQLMFRSSSHEVHTIEINKLALNRDDDKRISKRDEISTLAHGDRSLSWSPILGKLIFWLFNFLYSR